MTLALALLLAASASAAGAILVLLLQRRRQGGQLDQEQTRCLKCRQLASSCRCGEEEREGWIRERWWRL